MTSKEYETETSKESLLGGFVGTNITQTVSDSLLTSYKLRIGSEVDSKVYDPYFENRLGLILTSKLPVSSRGLSLELVGRYISKKLLLQTIEKRVFMFILTLG